MRCSGKWGPQNQKKDFPCTRLHIAGLPYTFAGQSCLDEITGCSPYGASTIAGNEEQRWPSENELEGARFQGRYVAEIASKLTWQSSFLENILVLLKTLRLHTFFSDSIRKYNPVFRHFRAAQT